MTGATRGRGSIINVSTIQGVVGPDFTLYEGLEWETPPDYFFHEVSGGKRTEMATFKLDATKKPKETDWTHAAGPSKGKTFKGIYDLRGDELRVCLSDGDDRPAEFRSNRHHFVMNLVRVGQ